MLFIKNSSLSKLSRFAQHRQKENNWIQSKIKYIFCKIAYRCLYFIQGCMSWVLKFLKHMVLLTGKKNCSTKVECVRWGANLKKYKSTWYVTYSFTNNELSTLKRYVFTQMYRYKWQPISKKTRSIIKKNFYFIWMSFSSE